MEGQREKPGEWINETDGMQNQTQTIAEIARYHQANLTKFQQQKQNEQQHIQYHVQDNDYSKQHYNGNIQQQQQAMVPYSMHDGKGYKML